MQAILYLLLLTCFELASPLVFSEIKRIHQVNGDHTDWIEVYNDQDVTIDLNAFSLSNGSLMAPLPSMRLSGHTYYSFTTDDCSEAVRFALSEEGGGTIILFETPAKFVDHLLYPALDEIESFRRELNVSMQAQMNQIHPQYMNDLIQSEAANESIRNDVAHADYWTKYPPYYPGATFNVNVRISEEAFNLVTEKDIDQYCEVQFNSQGPFYPATLKRHGIGTVKYDKKSYRIKLDDEGPYDLPYVELSGQQVEVRHIVFKAMWIDPLFFREKLAMDVVLTLGGLAPRTGFAHLSFNDQYWGLFTVFERIDGDFLKRRGLDKDGNLYKADRVDKCEVLGLYCYPSYPASFGENNELSGYVKERNEVGPSDDLRELLQTLSRTPTTETAFKVFIDPVFNLTEWVIYQKVLIWAGDRDAFYHNFFLYHDPNESESKFRVIPWDILATWGFLSGYSSRYHLLLPRLWGRDKFAPRYFNIDKNWNDFKMNMMHEMSTGAMSMQAVRAAAELHLALYTEDIERDHKRWPRDHHVEKKLLEGSVEDRMDYFIGLVDDRNEVLLRSIAIHGETLQSEKELYVASSLLIAISLPALIYLVYKGVNSSKRAIDELEMSSTKMDMFGSADGEAPDEYLPLSSEPDIHTEEPRTQAPDMPRMNEIASHTSGVIAAGFFSAWLCYFLFGVFFYWTCELDIFWRPGEPVFILFFSMFPIALLFYLSYRFWRLKYFHFSKKHLLSVAVFGVMLGVVGGLLTARLEANRAEASMHGGGRCNDGPDPVNVFFLVLVIGFCIPVLATMLVPKLVVNIYRLVKRTRQRSPSAAKASPYAGTTQVLEDVVSSSREYHSLLPRDSIRSQNNSD